MQELDQMMLFAWTFLFYDEGIELYQYNSDVKWVLSWVYGLIGQPEISRRPACQLQICMSMS